MNEIMLFIGLPEYPFYLGEKFNTSGKMSFKIIYNLIRSLRIAKFFRRFLPARTYQKVRDYSERFFIKRVDPISPLNRKALQEIYREDIVNLQSLIQRDLSNWLIWRGELGSRKGSIFFLIQWYSWRWLKKENGCYYWLRLRSNKTSLTNWVFNKLYKDSKMLGSIIPISIMSQ